MTRWVVILACWLVCLPICTSGVVPPSVLHRMRVNKQRKAHKLRQMEAFQKRHGAMPQRAAQSHCSASGECTPMGVFAHFRSQHGVIFCRDCDHVDTEGLFGKSATPRGAEECFERQNLLAAPAWEAVHYHGQDRVGSFSVTGGEEARKQLASHLALHRRHRGALSQRLSTQYRMTRASPF